MKNQDQALTLFHSKRGKRFRFDEWQIKEMYSTYWEFVAKLGVDISTGYVVTSEAKVITEIQYVSFFPVAQLDRLLPAIHYYVHNMNKVKVCKVDFFFSELEVPSVDSIVQERKESGHVQAINHIFASRCIELGLPLKRRDIWENRQVNELIVSGFQMGLSHDQICHNVLLYADSLNSQSYCAVA